METPQPERKLHFSPIGTHPPITVNSANFGFAKPIAEPQPNVFG